MLKSLELENFKAFGERVKIPFAPITLIFGENSSGKSSILQSLNLLKQTRESREAGALLLPRTEQGISDLGSFQDLLFDHDLSRTLSIKPEIGIRNSPNVMVETSRLLFGRSKELKRNNVEQKVLKEIGIEVKFKRPSLDEEVLLDEILLFVGDSSDCVAKFKYSSDVPNSIRREVFPFFNRERRVHSLNSKLARCVWVTKKHKYWLPRYELCKEKRENILEFLQKSKENLSRNDESIFQASFFDEFIDRGQEKNNILDILNKSINFYAKDFSLELFIERMVSSQLESYITMDGFLPYGLVRNREATLPEEEYPEFSRRNYSDRRVSIDMGRLAATFGRALEETIAILFPLGPFRRPPERWYIFTGTSPQDVGYKGELLPDLLFRRPKLVEEANRWLDKLDIGYHLKIMSLGERTKDLFEVQLIDTRRKPNVEVGLPDVGFGISQILPFIVQSLSSTEKIISIEQPEVHIHPRLQADLGDLLAETIKRPRNNQFIIETHSEHLVLRLQRLVRLKQLSPNDVSILYVSRGANGSKVQQLQLDEEGDFINDWPGGFFPERLREFR